MYTAGNITLNYTSCINDYNRISKINIADVSVTSSFIKYVLLVMF